MVMRIQVDHKSAAKEQHPRIGSCEVCARSPCGRRNFSNYKLENRGSVLVATGQREFPIRKRRRKVEI